MKRLFHVWWQPFAVACFTVFLALQVPRKALFFAPARETPAAPFVELVAPDDAAYAAMVRRARMSWQMRGNAGAVAGSRADAFDFAEPLPPPAYLPPPAPARVPPARPRAPAAAPADLAPPSAARETPGPPAVAPPDAADRDPALLQPPDSLQNDA